MAPRQPDEDLIMETAFPSIFKANLKREEIFSFPPLLKYLWIKYFWKILRREKEEANNLTVFLNYFI